MKYTLRTLGQTPGLTAICILTVALGIGASTTLFSVVDSILLKPLPYRNANRIVVLYRLPPKDLNLGYSELPWGQPEFKRLSERTAVFQEVAAFESTWFNLTGAGEPALIEGLSVSAPFFSVLGVEPQLGRTFTQAEDQPGREHEVILSDKLWRGKFAARPDILGHSIQLSGFDYTVIGVMPAGFTFPRASEMPDSFEFPKETQLWVPIAIPPAPPPYASAELAVIGLLKPETSAAALQSELDVFAGIEDREFPKSKGWFQAKTVSLRQQIIGDSRRPLLLLLSAVGLVLLIVCSNMANLLLAKSIERKAEFTLRTALGANKLQLFQQLMGESICLALVGGVLGAVIAIVGMGSVRLIAPSSLPRVSEIRPDWTLFAFAFAASLLAAMFFGLAPARGIAHLDIADVLREAGQRVAGPRHGNRLRNIIVTAEVSISLVLIISASLMVRSFSQLITVNPGFNPNRVLTFEISLPVSKYGDNARIVEFYKRALHDLSTGPGVVAAGIVEAVPMSGPTENTIIRIPGTTPLRSNAHPLVDYTIASPGYLKAIGTPLVTGRDFAETDTAASAPVTIINQTMARQFWPHQDAVGKQVIVPSAHAPLEVIGVSANIKRLSLGEKKEAGPEMYVPFTQNPWPPMSVMQVVVRTRSAPSNMASAVRRIIHSIDPDLPLAKMANLTEILSDSLARPRFSMLLLTAFGALGLVLALVGIYGVISYSVAQRTHEIGVRMALGAETADIFRMVIGAGARIGVAGTFIGIVGAFGLTRLFSRFLYGIQPVDPVTFLIVPVLMFVIVIVACCVPAVRATRVYPAVAIRTE